MKREEKGWRELMEKRRGTNGLFNLPEDRAGRWERAPDAIPNAAGGEGGHRATTPDRTTHTNSNYQQDRKGRSSDPR